MTAGYSTADVSPRLSNPDVSWNRSLRYFHVYVCCLVTLACPVGTLHYLLPVIYVAVLFFTDRGHVIIRLATIVFAVLGLTAVALLIDSFRGYEVNLAGAVLALPCYAFLFIALAERCDIRLSEHDYQQIVTLTAWFVIIQSLIGFLQFALSGGESDAVAGTFGLLDFTRGLFTIGQVFYSVCISAMVLFLMLEYRRPLVMVAVVMGLIAFILSQASHQVIFFVLSLLIVVMFQYRSIKSFFWTGTLVSVLLSVLFYLYPGTFEHGVGWYDKMFSTSRSPKHMVLDNSLNLAADVKTLLIGTGMGQFTSRGSLITTGDYLSINLPQAAVGKSDYYVKHVEPAVRIFNESGQGSAISKPYFSLVTLPVEFGLILSLLLIVMVCRLIKVNLRLSRSNLQGVSMTGVLGNIGLMYLVLLCTVENYIEFSQAWLAPLVLFVVAVSRGRQMQLN